MNAKNRLLDHVAAYGHRVNAKALFRHEASGPDHARTWVSTVDIELDNGVRLTGRGEASTKTRADILAAEEALRQVEAEPEVSWMADAMAGDALIKLAANVQLADKTPAERTAWLQAHESNAALAAHFHAWHKAGDPDVSAFGTGRNEHFEASIVEALIWRRHREQVLEGDTAEALKAVFVLLDR